MKLKKGNKEFIKPSEELRESKKFTIKEIIGGEILTRNFMVKQLPYFLFIILLMLIYIANRNGSEKNARRQVAIQKEIKELRSRSIAINYKLMNISTLSEVERSLNARGVHLKESVVPPKKIVIKK
ncbi:FtsL-like putative cell division protein [Bacteroidota bacterium]